jgi:hypothetical protein
VKLSREGGWATQAELMTSRRLLKEKFGKDVFEECAEEARQRWEAEHPE